MKRLIPSLLVTVITASAALASIVPDADTILYVNCETANGFGQNLATSRR